MKNIIVISFLVMLSAQNITYAQIKMSSISVSIGTTGGSNNNVDAKTILSYFPTSKYNTGFTHDSMTKSSDYNYNESNYNRGGSFKISASFLLNQHQSKSQEIRIGIMNHEYYKSNYESYFRAYRIDTLTSSQTGQQLFIDSIITKGRSFDLQVSNIVFDISYIVHSNQEKRLSGYTGVGFRQNVALSNTFTSYLYENSNSNNYFGGYFNSSYYYGFNREIETLKSNKKISYNLTQIYIPLGYQWRLSKRNYYLKHFYLYTEYTPSINFETVAGVKATYLNIGGFSGLKIKF